MPAAATRTGSPPSRASVLPARQFAITESKRVLDLPAGSEHAAGEGIAGRPRRVAEEARDLPGAEFLGALVPWPFRKFGFDQDKFVHRAGRLDHRRQLPGPDRMLVTTSRSVHEYCSGHVRRARPKGKFKAVRRRGRTAAMCLHLQVDEDHRLLNAGDTIALGTPIFTPYLEMPHLRTTTSRWLHGPARRRTATSSTTRS